MAVSFLHLDVTDCSYTPAWKSHSRDDTSPEGFNLQPMGPRGPQAAPMGSWKTSKERQPGQGSNVSTWSFVLDLMEFLRNHPRSQRILFFCFIVEIRQK